MQKNFFLEYNTLENSKTTTENLKININQYIFF